MEYRSPGGTGVDVGHLCTNLYPGGAGRTSPALAPDAGRRR